VESRITQEALRRHVLRVLRCWRERYVFGDEFLNGLQVQPVTQRSSIANDSLPKVQNLMCC
jgi:U2-associated protein SR140